MTFGRVGRLMAAMAVLGGLASCGLLVGLGNYADVPVDGGADATPRGDGSAPDARDGGDATLPPDGTSRDAVSDGSVPDSGKASDSAMPDTLGPEGGADASDGGDASDGDAMEASPYTAALGDASSWQSVDLAPLAGDAGLDAAALSGGFFGSAFDGRYLYLAPAASPVVAQFDTQSPAGFAAAWAFVDTSTLLEAPAPGFQGAAYDGTYVYFAPTSAPDFIVRYNTKGSGLSQMSSWTESQVLDHACAGCGTHISGVVLAPPYLYFLPMTGSPAASLFQYSFGAGGFASEDSGSWAFFDTHILTPEPAGMAGGAFDGRYIDMAVGPISFFSEIARFDTKADAAIANMGAWSSVPLIPPGADASTPVGYNGVVFDGTYIYTSTAASSDAGSFVVQVAAGNDAGTPAFVNVEQRFPAAPSLLGGVFDGRYVYFVPGPGASVALRYDSTLGAFTSTTTASGSFDSFDTSTLVPSAMGFAGGAFDGQYVYLIPNGSTVVARFQATKAPMGLPSTVTGGSFY